MGKTPEGFHSITPYFMVQGAKAAIERYKAAFGAETRMMMEMPGTDMVMHGELLIGNSMMFISDPAPGTDRQPPVEGELSSNAFYHYVDDVDTAYARAIEAGMTGVSAPEDMFWGDRTAVLNDGFGYNWTLACHTREVSEEEMAAAMKNMMEG
jgi:PhnB protein